MKRNVMTNPCPIVWLDIFDDIPSWRDSGRRVEVQMLDDSVKAGEVCANDVGFTGEDEYPIFEFEFDDGTVESIFNYEKFRYLN